MKQFVILSFLILACIVLSAQSEILGKWKTFDENSGKARAVIEIYQSGDSYASKVIQTFPEPGKDSDPICEKCPGEDKGKKIIGLEIIKDMGYDDGQMDKLAEELMELKAKIKTKISLDS